jgi:hypothetical protein
MSNNETFTILSVGAPLVEVGGDGPTTDWPGGVSVPDGAPTTAPVSLLNEWVRRWRVDAPSNVQANVSITDSPFGALVGIRRCVSTFRPLKLWDVARWPWWEVQLKRFTPSLVALWNLYSAPVPAACTWKDIGDNNGMQVTARGGDLVVVTFVSP